MNQCFKVPVHVPAGKRASPSLAYITGEIQKPNILDCKYWPNQISKMTYIPTNLPRNTIIDIVVALNPPNYINLRSSAFNLKGAISGNVFPRHSPEYDSKRVSVFLYSADIFWALPSFAHIPFFAFANVVYNSPR